MATVNVDLHQRFRSVPRLPSIQIENGNEDVNDLFIQKIWLISFAFLLDTLR